MKNLQHLTLAAIFAVGFFTTSQAQPSKDKLEREFDPVEFVNPFIGTGGHGHTFPGATAPFGMVQLSPDTRLSGWDGCGGYHFSDSIVYGFSHTHLSGTGVSDYGDVLLMPFQSDSRFAGDEDEPIYRSEFSKKTEVAEAGYYKMELRDAKATAELTATTRAGMHRYNFKADGNREIILDLDHRDLVTSGALKQVSETRFVGHRHSKAWAEDQRLYYVIEFSEPVLAFEQLNYKEGESAKVRPNLQVRPPTPYTAKFTFGQNNVPLLVKVGISAVDLVGAEANLTAEIPHWEFDEVVQQTQKQWSKELGKIQVQSKDADKKTVFYTALYHCMVAPNTFSDVDGRYLGTDHQIHPCDSGRTQYTIFSLWDTYRALHPLFTVIDQERTNDFIHTFLNQHEQGGRLPMWELAGNYTGCMIGYHAVPVIADAYVKGIDDYDVKAALKAMVASANADRLGIPHYAENGFLAAEIEAESVSKTLEYAYDDWCIAQMAQRIGKTNLAAEFYQRGLNYQNVFDPETKHMRARQNNQWFGPFDATEVNFNYTEANSWQYSFAAQHDIPGLMHRMGGKAVFEKKLDALFTVNSETSGRHQVDITGLIGQYAHGNEPSHHMAYLYNYTDNPSKTQQYVRQIMDELYWNGPDGLSGNEDCGQMSAWLVMSALGFYSVTPGEDYYHIGTPWFEGAQIHLENGKLFSLSASPDVVQGKQRQLALVGDEMEERLVITHDEIMQGGRLNFAKRPAGNPNWEAAVLPDATFYGKPKVSVPAVSKGAKAFTESTTVELNAATPGARIFYMLNGGEKQLYFEPISLTETTTLITWGEYDGWERSEKASTVFRKINGDWSISLATKYGNHYSAGGDGALIDQIRGGKDYRTGSWQGYEGINMIATIDLGTKTPVNEVVLGCLQDENSWIFMPTEMVVSCSKKGKKWKEMGRISNEIDWTQKGTILQDLLVKGNGKKTRYLKLEAVNRGECPELHKGAGYPCWLFVDEILVK